MNNKLLNNRIHRGTLLLQEYEFEIRYIKEKENVVVDALTRDIETDFKEDKKFQIGVNILKEKDGMYLLQANQQDQQNIREKEFKAAEITETT